MTKIYYDIADLKLINKFNKKKIVKGFTTNPSLMKKAGAKDYELYSKKILKICPNKSVSLEVFAGRAADTGKDPVPEIKKSIKLAKKFKNVEILWASVREPYNYTQARQLRCDIITIPPSIIEKIENFGKSFDQLTIETVNTFFKDAKSAGFKI